MPEVQWITEASTRAVSSYTHYFVISPNDTYDARSAEISFINKENNIEEKVVITQVQKDAIITFHYTVTIKKLHLVPIRIITLLVQKVES